MGMSQDEYARATAQSKSFVSAAVITFILYIFFYIPGLIANWLYYQDAKRTERVAGRSLPGTGCLTFLLFSNVIWVVLICAFLAMAVGGGR